jgi:hypothetical protein
VREERDREIERETGEKEGERERERERAARTWHTSTGGPSVAPLRATAEETAACRV